MSLRNNASATYVSEPFASVAVHIDDFPTFYESQPRAEIWSKEVDAHGLKMKVRISRASNSPIKNFLACTLNCDVPENTRYSIAWRATYARMISFPNEVAELTFVHPSSERTCWGFNDGEGISVVELLSQQNSLLDHVHVPRMRAVQSTQPDALRDTKLVVSYTPSTETFEETYYVNKAFLGSISSFFGRMFFGDFAEQGHVEHRLHDVNPYAFRAVLEALYDGDVRDFFTWTDVAKVVDYLDIGVLRRRFENDVHRLVADGADAQLLLQHAYYLKSSTAQKLIIQSASVEDLQRSFFPVLLLPDAVTTFRRKTKKEKKDGNA
ncbi:hypothetical protein AAVH_26672 [Aphelenchoides avenae]|nr:hypothetical protein AAVH_26672 [Aphelenchus avenae]